MCTCVRFLIPSARGIILFCAAPRTCTSFFFFPFAVLVLVDFYFYFYIFPLVIVIVLSISVLLSLLGVFVDFYTYPHLARPILLFWLFFFFTSVLCWDTTVSSRHVRPRSRRRRRRPRPRRPQKLPRPRVARRSKAKRTL